MIATGPAGTAVHAGVLVPWANTIVEAELHRVTGTRVIWHHARLVPASRTTGLDGRFLTGLIEAVPAALAQLSALPLNRAYLACTSAAFLYPELAGVAQQNASVALVTAFGAITGVLSALDARRIILLTPCPEDVTKTETQMFTLGGIRVTASASLGLSDGYDTVTPGQLKGLIHKISCAAGPGQAGDLLQPGDRAARAGR